MKKVLFIFGAVLLTVVASGLFATRDVEAQVSCAPVPHVFIPPQDNGLVFSGCTPFVTSSNWIECSFQGGTCNIPTSSPKQVRFGQSGRYNYRAPVTSNIGCNSTNFGGDPYPGVPKDCWYSELSPVILPSPPRSSQAPSASIVPPITWVACANEGEICNFSGNRFVRYGSLIFYFQVATNSIPCNNATFGDPQPGVAKRCAYGESVTVPPPPTSIPFKPIFPMEGTPPTTLSTSETFLLTPSDGLYTSGALMQGQQQPIIKNLTVRSFKSTQNPPPQVSFTAIDSKGEINATFSPNPCSPLAATSNLLCTTMTLPVSQASPGQHIIYITAKSTATPDAYSQMAYVVNIIPPPPAPTCPSGTTGAFPNCNVPCPSGTTGTNVPNCVVPCPAGSTGSGFPSCSPAPISCPPGTTGFAPNCTAPCPVGTFGGSLPNCTVPCPPGSTGAGLPNCSLTPTVDALLAQIEAVKAEINRILESQPCPPGTTGTSVKSGCNPILPLAYVLTDQNNTYAINALVNQSNTSARIKVTSSANTIPAGETRTISFSASSTKVGSLAASSLSASADNCIVTSLAPACTSTVTIYATEAGQYIVTFTASSEPGVSTSGTISYTVNITGAVYSVTPQQTSFDFIHGVADVRTTGFNITGTPGTITFLPLLPGTITDENSSPVSSSTSGIQATVAPNVCDPELVSCSLKGSSSPTLIITYTPPPGATPMNKTFYILGSTIATSKTAGQNWSQAVRVTVTVREAQ